MGRSMPNFSAMRNDCQEDAVATTCSPALVKIMFREKASRQLERDAGKHLGIEGRVPFGIAASSLRSNKFSYFEKGRIKSLTCGALWARD
eukprot:10645-Pyramimonas_sp.AAC.1